MNYSDALNQFGDDARQIEHLFRSAQRAGDEKSFAQALDSLYALAPQNPLYAAWHYRLAADETAAAATRSPLIASIASRTVWQTALIISVINGLLFWLLSDLFVLERALVLAIVWSPIYATCLMAFLVFAGKRPALRWITLTVGLAIAALYVFGVAWWRDDVRMDSDVSILLLIHLPALALFAVGFFVLGEQATTSADQRLARFAALIKAIEVVITGGLFIAAGGLFTGITFGLFRAININPPEWMILLFTAGGAGLVPTLAVAAVYRPDLAPQQQSFVDGLSRLIALVLRILLPLTLVVAAIYTVFILFNFMAPFHNRETLIIYNVMLFAVLGLIVGATPVYAEDVPPGLRSWLRRGLLTLAAFALLVAIYAMSAVLYRTWSDGFTPNRVTVIGWNLVNIGILGSFLYRQSRCAAAEWLPTVHATVHSGLTWYGVWAAVVMLTMPWVF